MSVALGAAGWGLALAACAATAWQRRIACGRAELTARAAHELRGPLTALRLGLDAARRTLGEPRALAALDLELRRAALALADLDAARAGRRAAERRETVELGELLRDLAASWGRVARVMGCDLQVESAPRPVRVRADRDRLAQACGNLLANAIEHGGGRVVLRARAAGRRVRIEVSDGGPGLPAAIPELMTGARQGRGRRGRGLAIASDIAARHGGRLSAAPAPRGARVALELPAERS